VTFERLTAGDWVAWVAALVLLVSTAVDWYGTTLGDEARRIEELAEPEGALGGEIEREVRADARIVAEGEERNAFQEDGFLDRLILLLVLASAALAFVAGIARAAGRRFEPPRTPSAVASGVAATATLLIAYRIVQEPGLDASTTVKFGALLALLASAALALGARASARAEHEGTAWHEEPTPAA
jgi:hypothetical protein